MPFQLHCVMKYSSNSENVGMVDTIEQEMPWMPDDATFETSALTAMSKMIAANSLAKFGSIQASDTLGIGGDIA